MNSTITYRLATIDELNFLIDLRKKELALFSDVPLSSKALKKTYDFYQEKMNKEECFTILGYDTNILVTMGTVYYYDCMPSNDNHSGKIGYITNIWTKEKYRQQGLAGSIINQLIEISKGRCGMLSLNATKQAIPLYLRKGFVYNDKNMVYQWEK